MTMGRLSSGVIKLMVVAFIVTVGLGIASATTIRALILESSERSSALYHAAQARADLNELRLADLEARTGATVDQAAVDALVANIGAHVMAATMDLNDAEARTTHDALQRFLVNAGELSDAREPTSTEAVVTQARYRSLLGRLNTIEAQAALDAEQARERAVTGTMLAAVLSLVGLTVIVLAAVRLNRRRFMDRVEHRYVDRYQAIINDTPDFVFVIEEDGELSYTSPAVDRISGSEHVTNVTHLLDMMDPGDAELVAASLVDPSIAPDTVVFPVRTPDGVDRKIEFRLSDQRANASVGAIVATGRDVTAQVELEERLHAQAMRDHLTGLPNRRALRVELKRAIERSHDRDHPVWLVLLDLDGFKGVNDTLGHPVGDALLTEVASRLRSEVRSNEVIGRLSGDEFALILSDIDSPELAQRAAERVARTVGQPFDIEGQSLVLGVSGGLVSSRQLDTTLSTSTGDGDTTVEDAQDNLFRRADIALYEAKNNGRGRIEVFEPSMEDLLIGQERLKREIEAAMSNHEFSLVYQPLLTVDGNVAVGFEALMRWDSPVLGTVPPLTFIPVCERSGLIHELGFWALRTSVGRLIEWQTAASNPDLSMSVNVSVVQLSDRDFVERLRQLLAETGLAPATLQLEVTESVIADRIDEIIERLTEIRAMGVRVALDDFGTGYSSMGQLQSLPVDTIKIDRSFITALNSNDERGEHVVNALVGLGQALGLQVVAEGVEEQEQLTALLGPQCDLAQGFLLARPLAVDDVMPFLIERAAEREFLRVEQL